VDRGEEHWATLCGPAGLGPRRRGWLSPRGPRHRAFGIAALRPASAQTHAEVLAKCGKAQ